MKIIATAAILLVSAAPLCAQTLESGSAAQAIAIAGGGGSGYNGGTIRQRIINNPDVAIGSAISTAPCEVAMGGGGSGGGVGLVLQFGVGDDECKALRRVQMAMTLGGVAEGAELACANFADYRAMRLRVGRPCVQDAAQAPPAPPLQVSVQSPPVVGPAQRNHNRPAYCRPGIANSECN